jgi:hypothetical protein
LHVIKVPARYEPPCGYPEDLFRIAPDCYAQVNAP